MMQPIVERRSIRKYLDKPIADAVVLNLLESARLAPSGSNTQPWHFIIIRDEAAKRKLAEVSHNQLWMVTAPVFIACVADIRSRIEPGTEANLDEESPQNELKQCIRDTAIAVEHIVLEATTIGLGTCWVAWFMQNEIRPLLGLSDDKYLVSILTVGYPAEDPKPRKRKELKEIVHYERW
jgi:nitroreductase